MKTLHLLYHLARADFLERVRRSSFLVTLLAIVAVTYLYLPALDSPAWVYINLGSVRPIYNSAWIGLSVALLMAEFLPLFVFYLVKNTVERDRRTGVGEIIATTPLSRPMYTLGKWLSNMAVLCAITLVTIFTSLILQFIRAEDFSVDVWALVSPFLFILLPELAIVAALAVLFECIDWLRGGFGNLVYYVIYGVLVLIGDLQGINTAWPNVYRACAANFASCKVMRQIDIGGAPLAGLPTFRFEGVVWSLDLVLPRLMWFVVAIGIALLAAVFFHRFDPSRVGKTLFAGLLNWLKPLVISFVTEARAGESQSGDESVGVPSLSAARIDLVSTIPARATGWSQFRQMFVAELRLTMKGIGLWWYLIAAGIIISGFLVTIEIARLVVLPLAMVWPVLLWSFLGVREVQHHTEPIIFSLPFALRRQLLMSWLVGALVALVMTSSVVLRVALVGDWATALFMLTGALFAPTLALALGCWSGSGKLFQAVYLFIWYLASVQGLLYVDFMAHVPVTVSLGVPWLFAGITLVLMLGAVAGRQRQLVS